jgi:predicted lipoprotein with Yx(FWY)xxD motif
VKSIVRNRSFALLLALTVALAAAASVAASLAAAGGSTASRSTGAQVKVRKTGLGKILVDSKGRTLYLFMKDKHGKSSCSGACAVNWPPYLTSGAPRAGTGAKAKLLGTTARAGGKLQVTYNHHPLYLFKFDARAGQTTGEKVDAFGARWYAVSAAGARVVPKAAPPPSNGGGYGGGGGSGPTGATGPTGTGGYRYGGY